MTIYGKSVSEYVRFQTPILVFILAVGVARLLFSLGGASATSVKYISLTASALIGLVIVSILVHTRGFGSYKQLLPLVAVQCLVAQVFSAAAVILAIVTGKDNIYTLSEYGGRTWSHAGAHLVLASLTATIVGWLVGSAILFVTKKLRPAGQANITPQGKAKAAGA
jgi:hypothetical protein